jgi:hypothetical protein
MGRISRLLGTRLILPCARGSFSANVVTGSTEAVTQGLSAKHNLSMRHDGLQESEDLLHAWKCETCQPRKHRLGVMYAIVTFFETRGWSGHEPNASADTSSQAR